MGPAIRGALVRAGLVAGGFTLVALAVEGIPAPGVLRAAGMLALPVALLSVLRRGERRLADASERLRARPVRPPGPAGPARRRP
jgi:hypothetical protein